MSTLRRTSSRSVVWLLLMAGGWSIVGQRASADKPATGALQLTARYRSVDAGANAQPRVHEKVLNWDADKTAIVVCDMWNEHWCAGATRRVVEMAPKMNRVIGEARRQGVLIVHAPSSCMQHYEGTPQRARATQAPSATDAPDDIQAWCRRLADEAELPIDDSDGGCDCLPMCRQHSPWTRQIETIEIAPADAVSDSGREIWNLFAERNIENVILMGVHTNMCVAGRPFGLRQMARGGKNVVLVRDLTDTMYNPRSAPYVAHQRGTDLVVGHIEQHICPSILAADIQGEAPGPHVVFVIGEDEYQTEQTLPDFASAELAPRGIRTTVVHASSEAPNNFSGLELALNDADLVVLSVRRRTPRQNQLAALRKYLDAGRPLVGIRTASHAFDRVAPAGHTRWASFDIDVLGADYQGHYGNKPPDDPLTYVRALPEAAKHPVLAGFPPGELKVTTHLYKNRDPAPTTTLLIVGHVEGQDALEPVAWTNTLAAGASFTHRWAIRLTSSCPRFVVC